METVQGGGAPCSGDLARPIQGLADWSPVPPPAMAAVCRKHQGSGHVGLVFSQAVGFVYGAQFRDGLPLLPRLLTCVSPPPAAAAHLAQSDCAGDSSLRMRGSE